MGSNVTPPPSIVAVRTFEREISLLAAAPEPVAVELLLESFGSGP